MKKGDEEKKVESEKEKTEDKPADVSMQSEGGNEAEKDASGKSHWSKLDPKSLKVGRFFSKNWNLYYLRFLKDFMMIILKVLKFVCEDM